jgi:hypothetical protein
MVFELRQYHLPQAIPSVLIQGNEKFFLSPALQGLLRIQLVAEFYDLFFGVPNTGGIIGPSIPLKNLKPEK